MKIWIPLLCAALVAGCATTEPKGPPTPSLQEVRANATAYQGQRVRWGGIIAGVENHERETCVAVVGRKLESGGRPSEDEQSDGRFLTCVNGFLDPMIYQEGREFTVTGVVTGSESRTIGEFPYVYPVVQAERHHLWEPRPVYVSDPFYDPWPYWGPGWGPYWGPGYYHPHYYPHRSAPKRWRDPRRP